MSMITIIFIFTYFPFINVVMVDLHSVFNLVDLISVENFPTYTRLIKLDSI